MWEDGSVGVVLVYSTLAADFFGLAINSVFGLMMLYSITAGDGIHEGGDPVTFLITPIKMNKSTGVRSIIIPIHFRP